MLFLWSINSILFGSFHDGYDPILEGSDAVEAEREVDAVSTVMSTEQSGEERLKARKPLPAPYPAYLPTAGSPLTVDQDLYDSIQQGARELVTSFVLPIRSGRAWKAPAGSIIRISTPEGPQVGMLASRHSTDNS